MSITTYAQLLAAGAPELPDDYFYRVFVWQDHEPFGFRPHVTTIQLVHKVLPSRAKAMVYPWLSYFMNNPAEGVVEGKGLRLEKSSYYEVYADYDLLEGLALAAAEMWQRNIAAIKAQRASVGALAYAKTFVGDHP